MNLIDRIKNNEIRVPIWVGQLLAYIPYSLKPIIGTQYRESKKDLRQYEHMNDQERKDYIFKKMSEMVSYAYDNIPFYHHLYNRKGFSPKLLKVFDDLEIIPIINKDDLIASPLEERSNMEQQHYVVNTGGSSGKTLSLCSQRKQMAVETAHCHEMYATIGYKPSDLKMSIVGRKTHLGACEYDFARHILFLSMYLPFRESALPLKSILRKNAIRYIQGYPSILFEFALYCKEDKELLNNIKKILKGVILNSEYPYEKYVSQIEATFNVPVLSFYGHTERCVLAYGDLNQKYKYYPFQTYGFTEAIASSDGKLHLVGTSYYNNASPLIRYDTDDIINSPEYSEGGILKSFEIQEGRSGQYIVDRKGNPVSLTGLIMGRHHLLFNYCIHIQVYQSEPGKATILYVPKESSEDFDAQKLMDLSDVDIVFSFKRLKTPIRTVHGKVNLLVKSL